MNYWLDLFTGTTWEEFRNAGSRISGFRKQMQNAANKVKPGDVFICYMTGVKHFVGALEVVGSIDDKTQIWSYDFPVRFQVKPIVELDPEHGIPLDMLEGKVEFFEGPTDRGGYKAFFRMSPNLFKQVKDGELILDLLKEASINPESHPIDARLLKRKPFFAAEIKSGKKTIETTVTIPEEDESDLGDSELEQVDIGAKSTKHTEIQYYLLTLGNEMGLDVWAARNDRNKDYNGKKFSALPKIIDELPTQFNEATTKTIELIDVLWLKGNSIIAAFEVECTTSIYSGLLRMSDLLALQPNLDIPIFIVAPDDRRNKVEQEILRPTFKLRHKPLNEICGFLSFSDLIKKINGIREHGLASSLNPHFLSKTAEYFNEDD